MKVCRMRPNSAAKDLTLNSFLGEFKEEKCFGNGRRAVRVLDEHFMYQDAALAIAANQGTAVLFS